MKKKKKKKKKINAAADAICFVNTWSCYLLKVKSYTNSTKITMMKAFFTFWALCCHIVCWLKEIFFVNKVLDDKKLMECLLAKYRQEGARLLKEVKCCKKALRRVYSRLPLMKNLTSQLAKFYCPLLFKVVKRRVRLLVKWISLFSKEAG